MADVKHNYPHFLVPAWAKSSKLPNKYLIAWFRFLKQEKLVVAHNTDLGCTCRTMLATPCAPSTFDTRSVVCGFCADICERCKQTCDSFHNDSKGVTQVCGACAGESVDDDDNEQCARCDMRCTSFYEDANGVEQVCLDCAGQTVDSDGDDDANSDAASDGDRMITDPAQPTLEYYVG